MEIYSIKVFEEWEGATKKRREGWRQIFYKGGLRDGEVAEKRVGSVQQFYKEE